MLLLKCATVSYTVFTDILLGDSRHANHSAFGRIFPHFPPFRAEFTEFRFFVHEHEALLGR